MDGPQEPGLLPNCLRLVSITSALEPILVVIQLTYKSGMTNYADALSKCLDLSEGVESDNKAQTLLLSRLFSDSSEILVESDRNMHINATKIILSNLLSLI